MILDQNFFDKDARQLAIALLGKVIRHHLQGHWLATRIIETEAYYLRDKASHSSLGYTHSRRAAYMAPGTIYMYYARGGDSLNFSARGQGNAVLIKAGYPHQDELSPEENIRLMQTLNPVSNRVREPERLCSGQTLLCRSMGLKVSEWNAQTPIAGQLHVEDTGYSPKAYVQTRRLGIPDGRDEHLPYRFIDHSFAAFCTRNPLTQRTGRRDYVIIDRCRADV